MARPIRIEYAGAVYHVTARGNERKSVVNGGSQFSPARLNLWGYNPKSELLSSHRHEGDNPDSPGTEITAEKRLYEYDQIGNRLQSTEGTGTATTYGANDANRYDWVQPRSDPREYLCYDDDGNLKRDGKASAECPGTDGLREYKWDAENRLIEVVPVSPSEDPPRNKKVRFVYDYMGRRVQKDVYIHSGGWPQNPDEVQRFVYDGWNVVLVLNDENETLRKFAWGLDLSGTIHGAGGIGGLVSAVEVHDPESSTDDERFWYFYDANGNVGQILTLDSASPLVIYRVAQYEYDPFGNIILLDDEYYDIYGDPQGVTCLFGLDNPFRFSTKWFDDETGLGYWGYRYYSPRLGRWISRDPMEQAGGPNLYAGLGNAPPNNVDPHGLATRVDFEGILHDPFEERQDLNNIAYRGYFTYEYSNFFGRTMLEIDEDVYLETDTDEHWGAELSLLVRIIPQGIIVVEGRHTRTWPDFVNRRDCGEFVFDVVWYSDCKIKAGIGPTFEIHGISLGVKGRLQASLGRTELARRHHVFEIPPRPRPPSPGHRCPAGQKACLSTCWRCPFQWYCVPEGTNCAVYDAEYCDDLFTPCPAGAE